MAQGNVVTPFLETRSFVHEASEVFSSETPAPIARSPFVSVYELEGFSQFLDPEQEAYSTLVQELYDHEFDEALFELMVAARGVHDEHLLATPQSVEGERLLNQHFNQLIREAEATVDAFGREFGGRDISTLNEGEIEGFAERYSPSSAVSPEFEEFLGKWAKKLARATRFVKKAGKFAMKLGLGPILNKIKALVRPLLNNVLQKAIGHLPASVQPAAQQLAERITESRGRRPQPLLRTRPGGARSLTLLAARRRPRPAPEEPASPVQAPPGRRSRRYSRSSISNCASVHGVGRSDMEFLEAARVRTDAQRPASPVYSDLIRRASASSTSCRI